MFNNFHNILVRNFENSFPSISVRNKQKSNNWITSGIKISCRRKRELYLLRRNSNNPQIVNYYDRYCSILKKVIVEAKKMHIHNQIHNSTNKIKTAWEII